MVDASQPGTVLVRVHWTPYWSIEQGTGCVEQAPGGYTMIDVTTPGRFRVGIDFTPVAGGQLRAPLSPGAGDPVRDGAVLGRARGGDRPHGRVAVDRSPSCGSASCPAGRWTCWSSSPCSPRPTRPGGTPGARSTAAWALSFSHARDLVSAERSLGLLIEPSVQHWAVHAGWPAEVARWGYANLHFKGSCLMLAVLYFGYRGSFGFVRNAVFAAMAISVIGYALFPTAPPRFLPELGLDPSSRVTGNNPLLSNPGDALFNPFAAVPSMHVGLSVILAVVAGDAGAAAR